MPGSTEKGTRQRILEVAETLFGERGYDGAKLHLIAQRVGIQKASLFHHFSSKEHLYHAVVREGISTSEQAAIQIFESSAQPLDRIKAAIETYIDMVAARPALTKILLRQSLGDPRDVDQQVAAPQRLLNLVAGFVADGQRAGVFAPVDPVGLMLGIGGMIVFFFSSAPVVAPVWCGETESAAYVKRVKQLVLYVLDCSLTKGEAAEPLAAGASA